MAKWGSEEQDPRWIVAHRDDGHNVNGWHWTEKNKVEWSRQKISELVQGLDCGDKANIKVTTVVNLTGEAYLTMRKGNRKFALYDLLITLGWEGWFGEPQREVSGEIKVSEFASTSEPEEYQLETTIKTGSGSDDATLIAAVNSLHPAILERLQEYVLALNELE